MAEPLQSANETPDAAAPSPLPRVESQPIGAEAVSTEPEWPKVYLLPNLMTAGNLVCGFAAALKMVEAASLMHPFTDETGVLLSPAGDITDHAVVMKIYWAIILILASCVFDMLDG